jgi:GNAT superfamily N-acetyltransferase
MSTYSVLSFPAQDIPKDYLPLIFSKWLRSLRYGNDMFKLIDVDAYYRTYHHYIGLILQRVDAVVRLAVLTDDKDVVLGFSVSHGSVLDYVHVHKDQRRQGIGMALLPLGIDTISHVTKTGLSIWGSKFREWKFNPFA